MWAKGVPEGIVTSVHSMDEKPDQDRSYNRVASIETGLAPKQHHTETYATCEEVCTAGSCLVYVPYKVRYGQNQAECLKTAPSVESTQQ